MGLKGFGGKAANVLGKMVAGDTSLLALLHALLQPADIAALVRTAARGAKAEDIEVGLFAQTGNTTYHLLSIVAPQTPLLHVPLAAQEQQQESFGRSLNLRPSGASLHDQRTSKNM